MGRDEEIRRVVQVLSRRTKNNPVLIGEPGVGKTAIAEGLARRIVEGDVPDGLKDKKVLSIDLGALIAGATCGRCLALRGALGVLRRVGPVRGRGLLPVASLELGKPTADEFARRGVAPGRLWAVCWGALLGVPQQ